ncbi:UNVERIFIED_CONTAM: hypothetical protein Sangu_1172300 [Sesamum angustifolium]|uniref:Uncharacterized protein n=1 Tax=Sesamum angustifolium TaxID=2727405 RepID=A0AAW2P0L6_9LAMI
MEDAQADKKDSCGEERKESKEETPTKKPRSDPREKNPPFLWVNALYTPPIVPITQALMVVEGRGLLTRPKLWKDGLNNLGLKNSIVSTITTVILSKNVGISRMRLRDLSKMDICKSTYVGRKLEEHGRTRNNNLTKQRIQKP